MNTSALKRMVFVGRLRGVHVYVHWSVFLIGVILLLNATRKPELALVVFSAYIGILLLHECGHMLAAHWTGHRVDYIELYPIFGVTCFDVPHSRRQYCAIAWGGVVAQAVIAVPVVAWVGAFGYSGIEPLNAIFALFGYYNLAVATFNLLPIGKLDGAIAWKLLPSLLASSKTPNRPPAKWRVY